MIVIALRQLHVTAPGQPIEVTPDQAKLLVQIGFAKYPDPDPQPVQTPTPRRRYQRRDLSAES